MAPESLDRRGEVLVRRRWLSRSADATEALGEQLGRLLRAGDVVALDGELGSGKTCLVRGIARALGVADGVASPSFTLMHEYQGRLPVYHLDAWMQARGEAFLQDGGAEWLTGPGVALIEWAERVAAWLPPAYLSVQLEHAGDDLRRIEAAWIGRAGERGELVAGLRGLETPAGCEVEA